MTALEAAVARELLLVVRQALGPDAEAPARSLAVGQPPAVEEPLALDEPLAARLDSLRLLTLVVAVEDRFQVALTDDDAATARSLADLARLVAARAPAARLPAVEPA